MRVCVIGTGYVGLVAGTCFAESGQDVRCLDIDADKIATLERGEVPFYEPGLADLILRNVVAGRLSFSTDVAEGIRAADVIFVAVGTPQDEDGSADLGHVLAVAEEIAEHANGPKLVVTKSTVPVGTADRIRDVLLRSQHDISVASNPEFLKEGDAVNDFMRPDRVVVGIDDLAAKQILGELYAPFVRNNNPILFMDNRSAEMVKYASNAMLATRISLMNDVANLCEAVGANVDHVRKGVGADSRIGRAFLYPGIGYGGSCFPKDVRALMRTAEESGGVLQILESVDAVNERQKLRLTDKLYSRFGWDLTGTRIAVWGLAFKPKTDDMREAPSVVVIENLLERGADVLAYDPEAMGNAERIFGDRIDLCDNKYECTIDADALLVVTEWGEFCKPSFGRVKRLMRTPLILDGRNMYDRAHLESRGFEYEGIGR